MFTSSAWKRLTGRGKLDSATRGVDKKGAVAAQGKQLQIERKDPMDDDPTIKQEDQVASVVADTTTTMNLSNLALGPSVAIDQTFFAQSHAQGILFANMLTEQQHTFATGSAAAMRATAEIYGIDEKALQFPEIISKSAKSE